MTQEDMNPGLESTNINNKWLENVFENIKKFEENEELARDGCSSLMEYAQIPPDQRATHVGDLMYASVKKLHTQLLLLLNDLIPIVSEKFHEEKFSLLKEIEKTMRVRRLFLYEPYDDTTGRLTASTPTDFMYDTLDLLSKVKGQIIKEIEGILYVKAADKPMSLASGQGAPIRY